MINIQLLEEFDKLSPDDWCRPLCLITMNNGQSDSMSFLGSYSGTPINNVKWARASAIFGSCWFGKTIKEINKCSIKHEFVRGEIPEKHKLNMTEYSDLEKILKGKN